MSLLLVWGIIIALIAVNAVYVAAEFAVVGAPRSRILQRAEAGEELARRLLPIATDARLLDQYIAVSQVGITLSSLILGAFGEISLAEPVGASLERLLALEPATGRSTGSILVLVTLTIAQMVLAELIPKSIALRHPTGTALWTVVPMQASLSVLRPFIAFLNGSGNAVLRWLGFREAAHRHVHSPQEIDLLIAESTEGGLLEPHEHRRLRQALHLGTRTAAELMVQRDAVHALDVRSGAEEALRAVTESPFTRLPIYQGSIDRIIGLVHTRDVAVELPAAAAHFDLRSLLRPVLFVPRDLPADRLLARMREARRQMAVVCDEYGSTLGIVSIDDILDAVLGDMADDLKEARVPERRHG